MSLHRGRFFLALPLTVGLLFATFSHGIAQTPQRIGVRGSVVSIDGNMLTVKTATASVKVELPDNVRVTYLVKSDLTKIGPGSYVGTAALPQPDGSLRALELQIFNDVTNPPEGHTPFDTAPGSTMTNAKIDTIAATSVDKIQGRILVLRYKDGEKHVFVPANVPIVTYEKADRSALTPGAHLILFAVPKADGTLTTASVNVGKDGLVPPM